MDKEATPKPTAHDYRGACVEDLQLPPAFCLPEDAPLLKALEAAYDREFDHLPILNAKRRPIGYLDIPSIKDQFKNNKIDADEPVSSRMIHFSLSSRSHPYTVISPLTPLEELEEFFKSRKIDFALVTDTERNWVLAVATKDDLVTFAQRRG
ncbi:hypothetical protein CNBK2960 [Cryptococcus deneoformans B-3501A]|uniref:CBS domain-containing protein n=1 Tax=Cryptococcus deneoformans (strain JEC21 / ATCC MYA-565) TaxID=214684 RepID=A0A0S2M614_CRYD1|nr:hypothetical protein CNK00480 [Cryptococcus neoformans var. neoformans JEC21]XP_772592.1 hypothetical protein CNBK2960 [Cryptococcus neoformans var. neoformans B-3501A]ALO69601.1 hypothetical protein CNK00480 [Cryptococcus neoformans var. neoformans JEC21]EAL17945.1 hypothetical protein CNBK2960 [Cryptococcus neoformans var. neoformans B-3501A]